MLQYFLFSPCLLPVLTPIEPILSIAAAKARKNLCLSLAKLCTTGLVRGSKNKAWSEAKRPNFPSKLPY